jgi:hypothetical protein
MQNENAPADGVQRESAREAGQVEAGANDPLTRRGG